MSSNLLCSDYHAHVFQKLRIVLPLLVSGLGTTNIVKELDLPLAQNLFELSKLQLYML